MSMIQTTNAAGDLVGATTNDMMSMGKVFAQSGMFPDAKSAAVCATKLIVGQGMGLNPYESMTGLHIITGKVTLSANLMATSIKRSGKYDYRSVTDDKTSTITFFDVQGAEPVELGSKTFTMAMAKRAGLGGPVWNNYPEAMLFARCISSGYREHCPDALGGAPVYVEEHGELEIGGTLVEHRATMAALPEPSLPPAAMQGGDDVPSLQAVEKQAEAPRSPGSASDQPTKLEFDVEKISAAGNPYKKHFVHLADGTKYGCFSNKVTTKLMHEISDAMDRGDKIEITYEESKWGKDLVGYNLLEPAADLEAPKPESIDISTDPIPF
jgi:hypothetical protein